jgi:hypothetical protein
MHLKNFYILVPALTISFVEHMLVQKEKIGKKGKNDGVFTDDGFVIGTHNTSFSIIALLCSYSSWLE